MTYISDIYEYGGSDGKASAYNAGDPGSIPGSGRSPGEGNGNPIQYSFLENPRNEQRVGHAWATSLSLSFQVHLTKRDNGISHLFEFYLNILENCQKQK